MAFNAYKVSIDSSSTILRKRGVLPGGHAQKALQSEVIRLSKPYVPYRDGFLASSVIPSSDGTHHIYNSPYARVHWFGKVMEGTVPKQVTNRDMKYFGAPLRGPKWAVRMWADHKNEILQVVTMMANKKG